MTVFIILFIWVSTSVVFSRENSINVYIVPELRTRAEYRDGFQKLATTSSNPAAFISQRTRLGLGVETTDMKFKIVPQDVRVWGDAQFGNTAGFTGNEASLDMFEGYAEFRFNRNHWIAAGRQVISYDNGWLLSDRNWNQSGIATDGIVLKLNFDQMQVYAGSSWNSLQELSFDNFYPTNRYKTLNHLRISSAIDKSKLSILHITTGQTLSETSNTLNFKHTSGLFYNKQWRDFFLNTNAYYQYGKNQKGNKVSAFMIYTDFGQKFSNLTIGGSTAYFTGNKKVGLNQTVDRNFDLIYTSRHRFLGFMDYFTNIAQHTNQGGLIHYALTFDYRLNSKTALQQSVHHFRLAQTNATTPFNKNLGFESDFTIKYRVNQSSMLEFGYLFYVPTKSLAQIQNVNNARLSRFIYLQMAINLGKISLKN